MIVVPLKWLIKSRLCANPGVWPPPPSLLKVTSLNTVAILTCDTWCPELLFGTCLTDVFWSLRGPETGVFVPASLRLVQVVCGSSLKTVKPLIRTHSAGPSYMLNGRSLTPIPSLAAALKGSRGKCMRVSVCACMYLCVWHGSTTCRCGSQWSSESIFAVQSGYASVHSSSHTLISGLRFVSCGYAAGGGWKCTQLCCLPQFSESIISIFSRLRWGSQGRCREAHLWPLLRACLRRDGVCSFVSFESCKLLISSSLLFVYS